MNLTQAFVWNVGVEGLKVLPQEGPKSRQEPARS